jgi:hypothetical protein
MMRERFIPRILETKPDDLVDASGKNLDPHKIWTAMFKNGRASSRALPLCGHRAPT